LVSRKTGRSKGDRFLFNKSCCPLFTFVLLNLHDVKTFVICHISSVFGPSGLVSICFSYIESECTISAGIGNP
jgi:hypothetical protein